MSSADFFKTETKRKFNFEEHIVFIDILFDNPDDEKSNFIPKLSFFQLLIDNIQQFPFII